MSQFLTDVITGLSAKEKYLQSKYFYDKKGDELFQKIMASAEYYPTKCEMEIFQQRTQQLVDTLTAQKKEFDVVELGAGDATKSFYLLQALSNAHINFTYYPVDISKNVIQILNNTLPARIPSLKMHGLNGEYFDMLEKAKTLSQQTKVVLFLGGNIGNIPSNKVVDFCSEMRSHLLPGDLVLIGFDLKKDPITVLNAYNDKTGFTREFNLNLLGRINEELHANFDLNSFYHYPTYDPGTGTCKSYLVSKKEQTVEVADTTFHFFQGEPIHMEIAQKYTVEQTDALAAALGYKVVEHVYDSKEWFLDAIWEVV